MKLNLILFSLLLTCSCITKINAQAPQQVNNVGSIAWYGLPNCTWSIQSNGAISTPCAPSVSGVNSVAVNSGTPQTGVVNLLNITRITHVTTLPTGTCSDLAALEILDNASPNPTIYGCVNPGSSAVWTLLGGSGGGSSGNTVLVTSLGLVCDGSTVNAPSVFVTINNYLIANDNTNLIFPSNSTCVLNGIAANPVIGPDWLLGVKKVRLYGNNTAIKNNQASGANNINFQGGGSSYTCYSGAITNPTIANDYTSVNINTVGAQSNSIVVTSPSSITSWQSGDMLLITGYAQLASGGGGGFPPSYRNFERKTLASIASGTINLTSPTEFNYNSQWFYDNTVNTFPPGVRNLTRPCAGGGNILIGDDLYLDGFDFTQTTGSQIPTTKLSGFKHISVVNSKLGYVYPSDSNLVEFIDSSAQWFEGDKLVGKVTWNNFKVTGNVQTPTLDCVVSGAGIKYFFSYNSISQCGFSMTPQNLQSYGDNFYPNPSNLYGYFNNHSTYARSASYTNPFLTSNGLAVAGIYNVGGGYSVTAQTVTSNTFTVNSGDTERTIELAGIGTQIIDHASGAIVAIVTDNPKLIAGVVTVPITGTITASEVIDLNPNPVSVNIQNPTLVDGDINLISPAFTSSTFGTIANLNFQYGGVTTVTNLPPGNIASIGVKHTVRNATSQNVLGSGSGNIWTQVYYQNVANGWVTIAGASGGGGITYTGGSSGTITIDNTAHTIDVNTSAVPQFAIAGIFTANQVFQKLQANPYTYATLPVVCSSLTDGTLEYITDSTVNTFNTVVNVGGGTNHTFIGCNGSLPNWVVK